MTLTKEEKERRKEERRLKKYNETHKIINNTEYKICNSCKEWLPCTDEYFYKVKNNLDGLRPDCKECTKKKATQWQQDNYERYHEWFTERNSKRGREYYYIVNKPWNEENKDRILKTKRNWDKNNPDKLRKYGKKRIQNKKHKISNKEWLSCKEYFNYSCAYCELHQDKHFRLWKGEMKQFDLHKEHVIHNGANDLSNCVPSCQSCNSSKHDFSLGDWYNEENPNYTEERLNKILKWLKEDYMNYIKF